MADDSPALPPPAWVRELPTGAGPPWVSMAVRALDLEHWLVFDEATDDELRLKLALREAHPGAVFRAEPGTEELGAEVAALVDGWIARDRRVPGPAAPGGLHPLEAAALRVPEDLCVLVPRDGRYVLVAASVSFPSHWRLGEKMGRSLAEIHRPVHHYEEELATKVDTFFTRLRTDRPVVRRNLSIHDHTELFRPEPPEDYDQRDPAPDALWARSERQTLLRLPMTGAVLFTIKTQQCPVEALRAVPEVAQALAERWRALLGELDRTGAPPPVPRWLPDWLEGDAPDRDERP